MPCKPTTTVWTSWISCFNNNCKAGFWCLELWPKMALLLLIKVCLKRMSNLSLSYSCFYKWHLKWIPRLYFPPILKFNFSNSLWLPWLFIHQPCASNYPELLRSCVVDNLSFVVQMHIILIEYLLEGGRKRRHLANSSDQNSNLAMQCTFAAWTLGKYHISK